LTTAPAELATGSAPVATASASLSFQWRATFSASGSSGLGALSSAWMLRARHAHASQRRCWAPKTHHRHISSHAAPVLLQVGKARRDGLSAATLKSPWPNAGTHCRCSTERWRGAVAEAARLIRTVRICRAGLHLSFRMSRQMRPSLSMLGWYIFVRKRTCAPHSTAAAYGQRELTLGRTSHLRRTLPPLRRVRGCRLGA